MKIALVYLGRKGGGPVYSLEITKRLQEKAEVLCFVSENVENLKEWRGQVKNLEVVKTYTNKLDFLFSLLFSWKKKELKQKIKKFGPDILYYPFFHFWLTSINRWFPKIPKVYTCHDPILHQGEQIWLQQKMQDKLLKQAKRVIILSSVFRDELILKGVKQKDIDVIPHGIFDYYFKISPNALKNFEHSPTILFFGRILDYKGLDLILRTFPLIKKQITSALLLIAGQGDITPYKSLIESQKDVLVINRWLGDSEVASIFEKADVLVCPYKQASQSGAIPVAYAFKMPVIATKVGGLVEQVDDAKTGFLVDPGDENGLAKACIVLLQDESLRKQYGENGYQKATTEWSWERISDMVLESLRNAIAN